MERDHYDKLVTEISSQLADKILSVEGDLTSRATTIDGDIAALVREIGLRTNKIVLEKTCEEIVRKKKPKI